MKEESGSREERYEKLDLFLYRINIYQFSLAVLTFNCSVSDKVHSDKFALNLY